MEAAPQTRASFLFSLKVKSPPPMGTCLSRTLTPPPSALMDAASAIPQRQPLNHTQPPQRAGKLVTQMPSKHRVISFIKHRRRLEERAASRHTAASACPGSGRNSVSNTCADPRRALVSTAVTEHRARVREQDSRPSRAEPASRFHGTE